MPRMNVFEAFIHSFIAHKSQRARERQRERPVGSCIHRLSLAVPLRKGLSSALQRFLSKKRMVAAARGAVVGGEVACSVVLLAQRPSHHAPPLSSQPPALSGAVQPAAPHLRFSSSEWQGTLDKRKRAIFCQLESRRSVAVTPASRRPRAPARASRVQNQSLAVMP